MRPLIAVAFAVAVAIAVTTGAARPAPSGAARAQAVGPLVALSVKTGSQVAGFPKVASGEVYAVVADGAGGWYVGGKFGVIGGVRCANLAHVLESLKIDRPWCPKPDGTVRALLRIGSKLYVGGEFIRRVAGASRSDLAAFDTSTGKLTPWSPRVVGEGVVEMAANAAGTTIYVVGAFDKIAGVSRSRLAAVDAASGRATGFAPNPDEDFHGNSVTVIAVGPRAVYAWGYFTKIGGASRPGAAAVDPQTGKALALSLPANGTPYDTVVVGRKAFIGGYFARFGSAKRDDLASFDLATGKLTSWYPKTGGDHVGALAPGSGSIVAVLEKDHYSSVPHRVEAFNRSTGAVTWRSPVRFRGYVFDVAASPSTVVVGGRFSSISSIR